MGNKVVGSVISMEEIDSMRTEFRNEGGTIYAYFPGSDIRMYQLGMYPTGDSNKFGINFLRQNSGFCSVVSDDVLNDRVGSAAMIDYAYAETLHGVADRIFMRGSTNAIRSRIKNIIQVVTDLAKETIDKKGEVRIYEAGCGFIRVPLQVNEYLKNAGYNPDFYYLGVDKNPEVVKTASEIAEFKGLSDKIEVRCGDALEELVKEGKFDLILSEGAWEYWNRAYLREFFEESLDHLNDSGYLVGTATHKIPWKTIAAHIGLYFPPMPEEDFIELFNDSGFKLTGLIKTDPSNISIGVGKKV